jgi:hypothetical protein
MLTNTGLQTCAQTLVHMNSRQKANTHF